MDGNTSSYFSGGNVNGGGVGDAGVVNVVVAANWVLLMPLDDAFALAYGSTSYASICDRLLLLPPTITNRLGDDSVELVLDDANLQF